MPPKLTNAKQLNSSQDRGVVRSYVALSYATPKNSNATIVIELLSPETCTSKTPCPLFMTQTNHRKWASIGVSRGYVACVYPGADADDQTDVFRLAYPDATWTLIPRRAWLASRALDYLLTLDTIIHDQVAITGHSRNGKQSMIAAAYDERFTSVISSSSGAPAMSPYRFTSSYTFSEDPYGPWPNAPHFVNCSCVRNTDSRPQVAQCCWWLPSVEELSGKENTIPIDSHALLGLIAPRFMLSQTADNDPCDPTYAVERAYMAGKKAYQFLGKEDNIRIRWRSGEHHGYETVATYFDWFDISFDRLPGQTANTMFPELLIHTFDWNAWNGSQQNTHSPAPAPTESLIKRVQWLTGFSDQAVGLVWSPAGSYTISFQPYMEEMIHRRNKMYDVSIDGTAKMTISFGRGIVGNVYFPANKTAKSSPMTGIVWLHPYSYQEGFTESYPRDSHRMPWVLAAECNAVVLAFDQIGFGRRLREGRPSEFYTRWPNWSLLGHMIQDVQSAVDALLAPRGVQCPDGEPLSAYYTHSVPPVDKVVVVGYAMGAIVGLHTAVLDERIDGVAACDGVSPLRNQTLAWRTGGNERLYEWHALLPRLGWFKAHEENIPYDYDDVLVELKDRPVLMYAPTEDRTVDSDSLTQTVHNAYEKVGQKWNVNFQTPNDTNKLDDNLQKAVTQWINREFKTSP